MLDVPPLLLILPLGSEEQVELFPGVFDDPWTAYRWFVGELPVDLLGEKRDPAIRWSPRRDDHGRLVIAYRDHHSGLLGFLAARSGQPEDDRRRMRSLGTLASARMTMHREGWPLPLIPDDVRPDLDEHLRPHRLRTEGDELVEIEPGEFDIELSGGTS